MSLHSFLTNKVAKKSLATGLICAVFAVVGSGCASVKVEYSGEKLSPLDTPATVINQLPEDGSYVVMGSAVAKANYEVERAKMAEVLAEKAAEVGATGVVITSHQVTPEASPVVVKESANMVDSNSALGDLRSDFDSGYGQSNIDFGFMPFFGGSSSSDNSTVRVNYIRVIKAEFIRNK